MKSSTPASPVTAPPETAQPRRDLAVVTRGLSKRYKIYRRSYHRLAELLSLGRRHLHEELWALRDIDIEIPSGIALGIVGSNGAGKSTFLKILTGTSAATRGTFAVAGRVSSLLELGAGFHMDFSGRENIYLNASVLGWSRAEVEERFDEVVAFSELGDFIEKPVRIYSTGMVMRLGFSIAISMKPDILIIDEVLAVGDQHFQKKCIERIHRFKEDGKTILFCSHSLYHIRQICDRAIWIRDGRLEMDGPPIDVTNEYANYERKLLRKYLARKKREAPAHKKLFPHITRVELCRGGESEPVRQVKTGDDLDVRIWYKLPDPSVEFNLAVGITRADDIQCFGSSCRHEGVREFRKTGFAIFRIHNLRLLAGEFTVSAFITDENTTMIYDQKVDEIEFKVDYKGWEIGLFLPDREWVFEDPA